MDTKEEKRKVKRKVKNIVRCNTCGRNIRINHRYKRVGELEYRYFGCKRCGSVYVISVTDEFLRHEIKRYQKLLEGLQTVPPEISQEAQLILQNNVERSRELKERYPLELKPWER